MSPAALLALILLGPPATAGADPARWLSDEFPAYVEIDAPSRLLADLRRGQVFADLEPLLPPDLVRIVETAAGLGVTRAAAGIAPAIRARGVAFAALLEAPDRERLRATLVGIAGRRIRIAEAGPFLAVADGLETLETVRAPGDGDGDAGRLSGRPDFRAFRERITGGDLRFHADIDLLLPVRPELKKPRDAGAVVFGAHLAAAAATARHVSGSLAFDGGLGLKLKVESAYTAPDAAFAFAAPPCGSAERLAPPDGFVGRVSFARDLDAFWRRREELLPASARAGLAEFRNNAGLLLGGLAVEDLFAGLGTGFDLVFAALPQIEPAPRHRWPAGALVARVGSAKLRGELQIAFQQVIGFVNADGTQKGRPRFLLENAVHRGTTILSARYPAESLAETGDDRVQLRPALAVAGEWLIAGSHPSIVTALVDRALDGRTEAREDGDSVLVDGPGALRVLRENAAAVAAGIVLEQGKALEQAEAETARLVRWTERIGRLAASLRVRGGQAAFEIALEAPGLLSAAAPGSGR